MRAELGALFDAADAAGASVTFLTASEVYDKIVAAPAPEPRDLVAECGLREASPMEAIGMTVAYSRPGGPPLDPPLLPRRPSRLPDALPAETPELAGAGAIDAAPPPVAHVIPLVSGSPGGVSGASAMHQKSLLDAPRVLPTLMTAPDVVLINLAASRTALERASELGGESTGITGFYGPRAEAGTLLQHSEVLCAELVQTHLAGVRAVYEIGCGLGGLSILLAARGVRAVGLERNGARLASAKAVAKAVARDSGGSFRSPRLIRGSFPNALRREGRLGQSVALVTNLLGRATSAQQQAFLARLCDFGAVLIDAQRFYSRRTTELQLAELVQLFADNGFGPPEPAFNLGPDGRFLLFLNSSPTPPRGLGALALRLRLARAAPIRLRD